MSESLASLLNEQLLRLQEIYELQQSEVALLEQRDAPALEQLTEDKVKLLSALEKADLEISKHPDRNNILNAPEYDALRVEIERWLAKVQAQNEINGQLVRLTLGRIQSMKQTLQSMHGENATTYDEKGNTRGGLSGKGIKA